MKVENMTSNKGNDVPNQFVLSGAVLQLPADTYTGTAFQSYDTIIAMIATHCGNTSNISKVFLDADSWDCSVTTGKYRNQFLGESIADTRKKIASGEYSLVDLNQE